MSESIEICSRIVGKVGINVKGEQRKITFVEKGKVGVALVDHDTAAVLLGLNNGDYWKPGAIKVPTTTTTTTTPPAKTDGGNPDPGAGSEGGGAADPTKTEGGAGSEGGAKKEDEDGDGYPDNAEGISALDNFNKFKAALNRCDKRDVVLAVQQIEMAKADPKQNRLDLINTRITALQ